MDRAAEELKETLSQSQCPSLSANGRALGHPNVLCLADVAPEGVRWLWRPYVPLGKLTLLEGDPGVGKTWLALRLAAIVSTGAGFPDPEQDGRPGEVRAPASVLYMTAEDGLHDTLRPRLDVCQADAGRVFALTGHRVTGADGYDREEPVYLHNTVVLKTALQWIRPELVIVDPLQGFLGETVDMHRANEVRPILSGIAKLAEEFGSAFVLVRHLAKSQQDRAVYRGLGSIDFAAAARSILLVGQDPQNPSGRAVCHIKSSLAPVGPSIGYELKDGEFLWSGVSSLTAQDLLRPDIEDDEQGALAEARSFLKGVLTDGPVPARDVLNQAKKAGVAEKTLRRAKEQLAIRTYKGEGEGKSAPWYWSMDGCHAS